MFSIIVAADLNYGIGYKGKLPWSLKGEMAHFKQMTIGHYPGRPGHGPIDQNQPRNAIIMGRKTWESLPVRPLRNRHNIVISGNSEYGLKDGIEDRNPYSVVSSLDDALERAILLETREIFIIGGKEIYDLALYHPDCNCIFLTRINAVFDCDTFFPVIENQSSWKQIATSSSVNEGEVYYKFEIWSKTK